VTIRHAEFKNTFSDVEDDMILTRHWDRERARWALDGRFLPANFDLGLLMQLPAERVKAFLAGLLTDEPASGELLAPVEPWQEVWACGVTYLRSREARVAESASGDIYTRVYAADRPELFFKATGARCRGDGQPIRVRADSAWNVPEPELVLALNSRGEMIGYTAGDDVSSRSIEGENPLYLPQAKIYTGSCAIGPGIVVGPPPARLPIHLDIQRAGQTVFQGETSTAQMRRTLAELAGWLFRELDFPNGAFLFTGTGLVPGDDFTLQSGDRVMIQVGEARLENRVA
jgi:2-dehydro-3-deoxy-D-arabinonate dehydratase